MHLRALHVGYVKCNKKENGGTGRGHSMVVIKVGGLTFNEVAELALCWMRRGLSYLEVVDAMQNAMCEHIPDKEHARGRRSV